MSWAELDIPMPPADIDENLYGWLTNLVTHLRNYLGSYHERGDPSTVDFTVGDFTTDGTWKSDFDLSSIVPAEAKAVHLRVYMVDNAVSSTISFRKNGNSNERSIGQGSTQIVNVGINYDFIVPLDQDRKIAYKGSNVTFSTLSMVVKGWWK